jgi:hypothetical protein
MRRGGGLKLALGGVGIALACWLKLSCGTIMGYKHLGAEDFNELKLSSLRPPHPHKIPWDSRNMYCDLFVNGTAVNVYVSDGEVRRAEQILKPQEKAKLQIIRDAWKQGWERGRKVGELMRRAPGPLAEKRELLEPEALAAPPGVPAEFSNLWGACWQHGYKEALAKTYPK